MSEPVNIQQRGSFRRRLLTSVSVLALTIICAGHDAEAAQDGDRPDIWIELGGQFERIDDGLQPFAPPFAASVAQNGFTSPSAIQRPPKIGYGAESKISFEPDGTDWVFSASVRYGRSNGDKRVHDQAGRTPVHFYFGTRALTYAPPKAAFSDTLAMHHESHMLLDFLAGKDIGLGLFGRSGSSIFSLGVRFAQFSAKSTATLYADPDYSLQRVAGYDLGVDPPTPKYHHTFHGAFHAERNAWAIGPSLSWSASAPFAGAKETREFSLDWGLNVAVLFGRQKAKGHHSTTGTHFYAPMVFETAYVLSAYHHSAPFDRSRSIIVPNIGGFAGVSLKFPNAKVSLGYRADFFFGAMDGGVDAAKKENVGFYGPFATISVGIGG